MLVRTDTKEESIHQVHKALISKSLLQNQMLFIKIKLLLIDNL
jgi:hypothetical protein